MLFYPVELTPDDNDTFLVTCPLLPEVTTFGADRTEALRNSVDAVEEAIGARLARWEDIPVGNPLSPGEGVRLPLSASMKVLLFLVCRSRGVNRAELARRLGWHREQVDRLFRLDHNSRIDQLDAAFKAAGEPFEEAVKRAAQQLKA